MGDSYYKLLGISPDASPDRIERAYREKLKKTHPDVSDDENASERTKRLIEAKEVLTDEAERARYDRLGHETYVDAERSPGDTAAWSADDSTSSTDRRDQSETTTTGGQSDSEAGGTRGSASAGAAGSKSGASTAGDRSTGGDGHATGRRKRREQRRRQGRHVRDESWYSSRNSRRDDGDGTAQQSGGDRWRVWNTEGSFAVHRDGDSYQHGRMFASERALILLVSTFVVYPVLLFGALLPGFHPVINLTVATCVVLVIAFLQSVPEVGIAVFGTWSLLLPIGMVVLGFDLVSIHGFLAVLAVIFPFGLSVLTRVAIRPVTAG